MSEELERLEKLKQDAKENPGKKVKGCSDCKKKKKVVEKLPELAEFTPILVLPNEEIIEAYKLFKANGNSPQDREKIMKVYKYVTGTDLPKKCWGCGGKYLRILEYKIRNELGIDI